MSSLIKKDLRKIEYDLEQTMAFSPPNTDDGFFLIKYKRYDEQPVQPKPKIVESKFTPKLQTFSEEPPSPAPSILKHIGASNAAPREVEMRSPGEQALTKFSASNSNDSNESEPSFGSTSIVGVAHKMMAAENSQTTDSLIPPRFLVRRNSKSLPASPQTSPKVFRKNPFFANIFFGSTELVNVAEEANQMTRTVSTDGTLGADSWSSRVVRAFADSGSPPTPKKGSPQPPAKTLKAKPSELREMNFWSPTSM